MLTLIGTGLSDGKDITLRGLEMIRESDAVFIEGYTSLLQCTHEELEKTLGRTITILDRTAVESQIESIIERAKEEKISILVIGDPFGATTHTDLYLRARHSGVDVLVIHNASIMNAVGEVGLELYRFGKTVSVPYWLKSFEPTSFIEGMAENQARGLHTLCLLDIKVDEKRFMSVKEGIEHIKNAEKKTGKTVLHGSIIGIARLGCADQKIVFAKPEELMTIDFGPSPHSIVIPGKLHSVEEEMLDLWRPE